jgi:hypothetical protein
MSNLESLPAELIDMVSASLSNADLLNLRTQSRTLRHGTTFEFCRRFFKEEFEVVGSRTAIRTLASVLSNPDFSGKVLSRALVVTNPTKKDLTPGARTILPTAKDVNGLLAALLGLQTLTIKTTKINVVPQDDVRYQRPPPAPLVKGCEDLAPALLKGLVRKACPVSQLTTLDLDGCYLDGALLTKTLLAHKHSLKKVSLNHCVLRHSKNPVRWFEIFEVLSQLDLDELILDELLNPSVKMCIVMCADSKNDGYIWSSHRDEASIKLRAEGGNVGPTGSAKYSRHFAQFTESYVELGLRRLLKIEDFQIW